jgi:hypothetical protein
MLAGMMIIMVAVNMTNIEVGIIVVVMMTIMEMIVVVTAVSIVTTRKTFNV